MSDEPAAVRLYAESDHEHVIALAGRLAVGVASWRSTTAAVHAAHQWTAASTSRAPDEGAAFVAERRRSVVGFVSVSTRLHFTGAVDAYIGELVVADTAARTGVGRQLVAAAGPGPATAASSASTSRPARPMSRPAASTPRSASRRKRSRSASSCRSRGSRASCLPVRRPSGSTSRALRIAVHGSRIGSLCRFGQEELDEFGSAVGEAVDDVSADAGSDDDVGVAEDGEVGADGS